MASAFIRGLYSTIFRRTSTFTVAVIGAAFVAEAVIDSGTDAVWDRINKGRQWKDIRNLYIEKAEE
ncbi:cytochrome b-c1 complex subunit 9 [Cladochytrium replicatum]|nr:cytochrome b-c1 complex subunit 9 [Cladochytrium replicatum]